MKTLQFKNGDKMPVLGLGTWKSGSGEVFEAVKHAIKTGYRHIDCAPIYGNEKEVGNAIKACIDDGTVRREDLWITSKLWNNAHKKNQVLSALQKTLNDLQLEYLDLYLVHWPVALKEGVSFVRSGDDFYSLEEVPLTETWHGMEEVFDEGLVKHIGVSNFGKNSLETILAAASVAPEMNQVECHPYLQQEELLAFCRDRDIHLTAYSPLGSPDRSAMIKGENEPELLTDTTIKSIANSKNASTAQILLSWAIHRSVAVIPKSVNAKRIVENFDSKNIQLSDNEMDKITNLNKNFRYVDGTFWTIKNSPYTLESLWG